MLAFDLVGSLFSYNQVSTLDQAWTKQTNHIITLCTSSISVFMYVRKLLHTTETDDCYDFLGLYCLEMNRPCFELVEETKHNKNWRLNRFNGFWYLMWPLFASLFHPEEHIFTIVFSNGCNSAYSQNNQLDFKLTWNVDTVLHPNNNHPKCRQNAVFIWNGIYSEVVLIHEMKNPF